MDAVEVAKSNDTNSRYITKITHNNEVPDTHGQNKTWHVVTVA